MSQHIWQFLAAWTLDPILSPLIIVTAVTYLAAAAAVSRRNPDQPWPWQKTANFLSGLGVCWLALLGPIGSWDDVFFWSHMVEHIMLTMLVAPLLLLGSPVLLILRVSSPAVRRRCIVPILRSRAVRVLTNPVVGWVLFAAILLGVHFTPFYEFAITHPNVHNYVEHPLFLFGAMIFYYPLLDGNPQPRHVPHWARVASLGLMMVPEAMTGFFIYAANHVLYPYYATVVRPFGPGPLADQQLGGAIMWGGSMVLDAAWVTFAAIEWLRAEQVKTVRLDASMAREAVIT